MSWMSCMRPLPCLRSSVELLLLRVRLPRMFEREPLDALLARLEAWRPSARTTRAKLDASIKTTEALLARLRLVPDTCLYRSMARYALLRGHGVEVLFCIGVSASADGADGHAWIEDEDGPYGEEIEDGRYVVTYSHPRCE
jgi:hypothetical protein